MSTWPPTGQQVPWWCDDSVVAHLPRSEAGEVLEPGVFLLLDGSARAALMTVTGSGGRVPDGARAHRLADPLEPTAAPGRAPDVLGIGAQRSGTTWLHRELCSHPGVWDCGIKEFHHFDWDGHDPAVGRFRQMNALRALATAPGAPATRALLRHGFAGGNAWADYTATFAEAPTTALVCDFTPAYATLDDAGVAAIAARMPDAQVLIVLRDPVTRAVSGALHELAWAGIGSPSEAELLEACRSPGNELRTDYVRTLDIWQRHYDPSRITVVFHDDIASDPDGVRRRVFEAVGLHPQPPVAPEAPGVVNAGGGPVAWPELARVKSALSRRWLPMLGELEDRLARRGDDASAVRQWRRAARSRVRAGLLAAGGAAAGGAHSVENNLATWDLAHPWSLEGDEWDGQAAACGVGYERWKELVMARYLPLFPEGGTLLEIGPGHGRWTEWLVERAGLLVLCDISANCLDACRNRGLASRGRLRTHVAEAADLPADLTGSVDGIWSFDCFVHLGPAETEAYVAEVARVLRPGAAAVLHHPGGGTREPDPVASGWRSEVSREDVRRWAESAGLAVERQESEWAVAGPDGPERAGVPRFGDCITVLRRVA